MWDFIKCPNLFLPKLISDRYLHIGHVPEWATLWKTCILYIALLHTENKFPGLTAGVQEKHFLFLKNSSKLRKVILFHSVRKKPQLFSKLVSQREKIRRKKKRKHMHKEKKKKQRKAKLNTNISNSSQSKYLQFLISVLNFLVCCWFR